MKICSWNVNGLRAVLRKGALQQFLEEQQPDILCLQEIKAKPDQVDYDFPGYQVLWNPAKRPGYSGTAVLFSEQLECGRVTDMEGIPRSSQARSAERTPREGNVRQDPPTLTEQISEENDIASREGRVLIADCSKFYLVNVYVPNSKPDLSRLKLREQDWDPGFLQLLKALEKDKPVVTCGDFNAAHNEIDLARPKTNHHNAGFTDEERKGITNLIKAGFVDTFRTLHPGAQRYTWWSHWGHARANNVGWRIDYFFISESLQKNLKSAEIYEHYQGSDHCPISIDLEF